MSHTVTIILASSIIKDGNLVISGGTKVFHLPPGIAPPGATVAPGASVGTVSPGGGVQATPDPGVGRLLFPPTGNNQDGSSAAGVGGRRVVEVLKGQLLLMYFSLLVYSVRYTVPICTSTVPVPGSRNQCCGSVTCDLQRANKKLIFF